MATEYRFLLQVNLSVNQCIDSLDYSSLLPSSFLLQGENNLTSSSPLTNVERGDSVIHQPPALALAPCAHNHAQKHPYLQTASQHAQAYTALDSHPLLASYVLTLYHRSDLVYCEKNQTSLHLPLSQSHRVPPLIYAA